MRRAALAAAALLFLTSASANAATTTVHIVNYTFNPNAPKVALNDSVAWRNDSDRTHNVTPNVAPVWPGSTGNVSSGKSFAMAFMHAGAYPYHCAIHTAQNMKGSVKVKMSVSPASGNTSTNFTIRVATQN